MEDILYIIDSDPKQTHFKYSMTSNSIYLHYTLNSFKRFILRTKHGTHQIKIYFARNVLVIIHYSILYHLDLFYGHPKFIQYNCVARKTP